MSWWGDTINSLTGTSTSAKQQFHNQMALQKDAQNFSKWQMANAHQMEVEDMKKAGINPVLSAGGSGASAGVSEGSASSGSPQMGLDTIVGMINTAKDLAKTNKEMEQIDNDIKNNTNLTEAQIRNLDANTGLTNQTTEVNEPNEETSKALKWWNSTWAGKALNVAGDIIGKISPFTAQAIQYNGAKQIRKGLESPTTTVSNIYNKRGEITGSKKTTTRRNSAKH